VKICEVDAGRHESELSTDIRQQGEANRIDLQCPWPTRPCRPGRRAESCARKKRFAFGIRHFLARIDALPQRAEIRSELA
jgi:hypothetical protein